MLCCERTLYCARGDHGVVTMVMAMMEARAAESAAAALAAEKARLEKLATG